MQSSFSIVRQDQFIKATRDSGYKGTHSALSELIDNSIQAGASEVHIRLVAVEQEVLYGEGTTEQAKRIIEAALVVPPAPNLSAIPAGTKLKALYLTSKGEAYVDLSPEVQKNHPGGTNSEMLTVYALVNTLTSNLPAITGVQLLIDGKEIDTLAGHLDLRRPIAQNLTYANRQSNP